MSNNTSSAKPVKSAGWFINFIGFIAVICVGISLLLSKVGLTGSVSNAFATIANVISYVILVTISCFYVARKRNIWLWVVWAIAVILIIVAFFL